MIRERNIVPTDAIVYDPSPDPDPDLSISEIDHSHDWLIGTRWSECRRCRMRDYFPGAGDPCGISERVKSKKKDLSAEEARSLLTAEVNRFIDKWEHGALPSLTDWAAEWFEWRRIRGG